MPTIRRFDHVGITVADLHKASAFFVGLGFEVEGRTFVEGEFLDTVCGIPDSRAEIIMLRPPDGGTRIELSSFIRPEHDPGSPDAMANQLGLRNIAFEVDDLQAVVERLTADGYSLVGGIGEYEHMWRMTYVRGPEGIRSRPGITRRSTRTTSHSQALPGDALPAAWRTAPQPSRGPRRDWPSEPVPAPDIDRGLAHLLAEPPLRVDFREKVTKCSLEDLTSVAEQVRRRVGQ